MASPGPSCCCAQRLKTAANASTSSALNTSWNVDPAGVFSRVEPSPRTTTGSCSPLPSRATRPSPKVSTRLRPNSPPSLPPLYLTADNRKTVAVRDGGALFDQAGLKLGRLQGASDGIVRRRPPASGHRGRDD